MTPTSKRIMELAEFSEKHASETFHGELDAAWPDEVEPDLQDSFNIMTELARITTPRKENARLMPLIQALIQDREQLIEALENYDRAFTCLDPEDRDSRFNMRKAIIKARNAIQESEKRMEEL